MMILVWMNGALYIQKKKGWQVLAEKIKKRGPGDDVTGRLDAKGTRAMMANDDAMHVAVPPVAAATTNSFWPFKSKIQYLIYNSYKRL